MAGERECLKLANEAEIVERAKTDDAAFEILYNFYLPKIYGYIFKRTGHREAAEDIVSEVFMKVFCNIKKYNHRGFSFGAWLYKIATNNLIDYYRRQGRKNEIDLESIAEPASAPNLLTKPMEDQNDAKIIQFTLKKLPKKFQEILQLRYFAELTNFEIAETLKLTEVNVRVTIHRALKKFSEIYKKYAGK